MQSVNVRSFAKTTAFVAAMTALHPSIANAFEAVLNAPGASEALVSRLEAGSLAVTFAADDKKEYSSSEILAAARSDYTTMVSLLYDAGYFSPVVSIKVDGQEAADVAPLLVPEAISTVVIDVQPGPPFVFGRASVGPLAPDTVLPDSFAPGQSASTGAVRGAVRTAITDWRDAGHAKADIAGESIVADHRNATLDVDIDLLPGPELTFGKLTLSGNEDVRSDAILRIAGYPEGERFSPDEVRTVTRRLRRTGAFSSVKLTEAETPNPDDSLDMELQVGEALKRRFSAGAEISTDKGLELSGEWIHRNLFGGAERLTLEARIGTSETTGEFDGRIAARLDRPAFFGTDNDLFYFAGLEYLDEPNYDTLNLYAGAGVRRVFSEYLTGEIGIGPFYSDADDAFGSGRLFKHIRFPFLLQWDRRDDPLDAKKGFYFGTTASPYWGIDNTESGMTALFDGRSYLNVSPGAGIVLAGRALLGTVVGSSLRGTAPDLLYYSGGVNTVRGQPLDSLGVPVGNGIVGGRSFLGLSAEVRKSVSDALTLVGFYDYGMVGPEAYLDDQADSHSGAGIGARYGLPGIGALRIDLGLPVTGNTGDGLQFYIGIGQAF